MTPGCMLKNTLLIFLVAVAVSFGFMLGRGDPNAPPREIGDALSPPDAPSRDDETPLGVLGTVPAFALTDQSRRAFGSEDLRGEPWIASFIFTRCPVACPMVMSNKVRLRDALSREDADDSVALVSFTIDPEHDTAEVLQRYAHGFGADPDRWRFLTGTRQQIWQLSIEGFKLPVMETPDEGEGPITHSSHLILVDGDGRVRGYYDGLVDTSTDRIVRDLARLRNAPTVETHVSFAAPIAAPVVVTVSNAEADKTEPRDVTYPPPLARTAWLEGRRRAQLADAEDLAVFHDFTFTDRLPESGIRFRHRVVDDAARTYRAVHYDHGNGLAIADVDGDGREDIYFSNQVGSNQLWRNLGGGRFEDVTASAGVAVTEPIGVTASFADIDNDGDADLYVTNLRTGNVLFRNDGTGRFTDISAGSGVDHRGHCSSAVFFDYDRDGLLDLFLCNVGQYTSSERRPVTNDATTAGREAGQFHFYDGFKDGFAGHLKPERSEASILYRNLGEGRFQDVSEATGLMDTIWAGDAFPLDVNRDGWMDLYLVNMQGHDAYYENIGGRRFARRSREVFPRTPWGSMGIQVFDLENDGDMDLFVTDMHSDMSRNVGPPSEKLKSNMKWPESFLQSGGKSIFGNAFYENRGDGTFREISDTLGAENYWPWGLSAGDLNADGYEDLFVSSSMNFPFRYGVNTLLLNDRGNRLADAEFILGVEPRRDGRLTAPWFELDCDGPDRELYFCTSDPIASMIDRERSGNRFIVHGALGSRSSVIFDLDGDGDLDIVTGEFHTEPMVLTSDLSERKPIRYLKIALEGTASNRSGLGARVEVHAAGRTYTKVHHGQSGYLSQSLAPLYFGLDDAENVDRIRVLWPSGQEQVVAGPLEINRRLTIVEDTKE